MADINLYTNELPELFYFIKGDTDAASPRLILNFRYVKEKNSLIAENYLADF